MQVCTPKGQRRSCGLIYHEQHVQACKVCSRLGRLRIDNKLLLASYTTPRAMQRLCDMPQGIQALWSGSVR